MVVQVIRAHRATNRCRLHRTSEHSCMGRITQHNLDALSQLTTSHFEMRGSEFADDTESSPLTHVRKIYLTPSSHLLSTSPGPVLNDRIGCEAPGVDVRRWQMSRVVDWRTACDQGERMAVGSASSHCNVSGGTSWLTTNRNGLWLVACGLCQAGPPHMCDRTRALSYMPYSAGPISPYKVPGRGQRDVGCGRGWWHCTCFQQNFR